MGMPKPLAPKDGVFKSGQLPKYKPCKGCSRVFNQKGCKVCPHCKHRNNGKRA